MKMREESDYQHYVYNSIQLPRHCHSIVTLPWTPDLLPTLAVHCMPGQIM